MTEEDFKKRREKKAKEKRKKAAIQMADTEYKLQKKYSNPSRKPRI